MSNTVHGFAGINGFFPHSFNLMCYRLMYSYRFCHFRVCIAFCWYCNPIYGNCLRWQMLIGCRMPRLFDVLGVASQKTLTILNLLFPLLVFRPELAFALLNEILRCMRRMYGNFPCLLLKRFCLRHLRILCHSTEQDRLPKSRPDKSDKFRVVARIMSNYDSTGMDSSQIIPVVDAIKWGKRGVFE